VILNGKGKRTLMKGNRFLFHHEFMTPRIMLFLKLITLPSLALSMSCQTFSIDSLTSHLSLAKKVRLCTASTDSSSAPKPKPLLVFGHGNLGGGPLVQTYDAMFSDWVDDFVIAAYESCWVDGSCLASGQGDFLEILKVIEYLTDPENSESALVDPTLPVSISGHSSGARAVLVAGSFKDNPETYLQSSEFQDLLTPNLYAAASMIGSIVSNHPDKMYDPKLSPDTANYDISKTPTMILTGSKDRIEETNSAWLDFGMMSVQNKIYLNVLGATHNEPINGHRCSKITSQFFRAFSLSDAEALEGLYEVPGEDAPFTIAKKGDRNSPEAFGYLACADDEAATVPAEYSEFCAPFKASSSSLSSSSSSDPKSPPIWGGALQWSSTVHMTNPADSKTNPTWTFDYFYDAVLGAELYKHYKGQGDEVCKKMKGSKNVECWVLNAADGNTYVTGVEEKTCCKYPMHLGMILPDWLQNSNATYAGSQEFDWDGDSVEADEWVCDGQYTNHYVDTAEGERPVRFYEHKGEDLKQWDFVEDSYIQGKPEEGLFEVPEGCKRLCL